MSKKHKIDQAFQKKLEGFEKQPPEMIWNAVSENLNDRKRKKAVIFFFRVAAGFALLAGLGLGAYYLSVGDQDSIRDVAVHPPEEQGTEESSGKEEQTVASALQEADTSNRTSEKGAGTSPLYGGKAAEKEKNTGNGLMQEDVFSEDPSIQEKKNVLEDPENKGEIINRNFRLAELPIQIEAPAVQEKQLMPDKQETNYTWEMLNPAPDEVAEQENSGGILSLAAVATPIYSYRDISNQKMDFGSYTNVSENAKISYSGGFQLGIKASSRISIETGLVYSRMGVGVENLYGLAFMDSKGSNQYSEDSRAIFMVSNSIGTIREENNNEGYVSALSGGNSPEKFSADRNDLLYAPVGNSAGNASIDQFFHFLELPVLLKYKVIDRKIDFNFLGGLSTNFLVANKVFLNTDGDDIYLGRTEDIRSVNYSGNFGIGMDYSISESFLFTLEPLFKYYINSFNRENMLSTRPYSLGFYTGIRYNF